VVYNRRYDGVLNFEVFVVSNSLRLRGKHITGDNRQVQPTLQAAKVGAGE